MKIDVNDIIGKSFGKWTVLKFSYKTLYKYKTKHQFNYFYLCKCACGTEKIVERKNLLSGQSCSCGCVHKKAENLTNQKFNHLLVLELHHKEQRYYKDGRKRGFSYFYLCKCDCGNTIIVNGNHLKRNYTQSCGCVKRDSSLIKGKIGNRLYITYKNMLNRCYKKTDKRYNNYGGRGIKVCSEWRKSFDNFFNWAIQNNYADNLTLDRIDVNGNYEPSNCRFATITEQCNNRRSNINITYQNQTKTLKEWCKEKNLKYSTIRTRIVELGWSIEDAFTKRVRG